MKIWMIVAVVGMLAIAGFALVNALDFSEAEEPTVSSQPTCGGGCSAGNTCGNPTCGVERTGSCGCGAR
jgi:hypothetical protein